ncbi:unnamed protein product [Thelazia callipaeda]|uniref:Nucleolar protein 10 n=1 Tax=Thelazia callipaeda TaxID=103827 RepID=A0A0N5D0I8_THECL|nr:unnamed protein product [Thelazia callipaeda]
MYLRYYLDKDGNRVYTLKSTHLEGEKIYSAHPARFSPEDKNSKYRIIVKKRFGILPTMLPKPCKHIDFIMLVWEWRRKWRQYIRNRQPPPRSTYQKLSKKYQKVSFILFVIGWHLSGFVLWKKLTETVKKKRHDNVSLRDLPRKGFFELAEEKVFDDSDFENDDN